MPKILLKFETSVIRDIPLEKPAFTVGRKPDNDIVLDNPTVSGHHCKIYEAGGTWFVEDLNSTNGTYVNGKKVLKAGLRPNDSVGVVKYSLTFMDGAAGGPAKAPEPALPQQKARVQGGLEVLEGGNDDKTQYDLTNLSTYVGKTPQANIQYKGAGLFNSGPDIAVVITLRPEGYYLIPIKEGFATHNGNSLTEKTPLNDDDVIGVGATKFRFYLKK